MNLHEVYLAAQIAGENSGDVDLSDYYTKSQTDSLISEKVDKEQGKGLSTNDFTTALKNKLDSLQNIAVLDNMEDFNALTTKTADFYFIKEV